MVCNISEEGLLSDKKIAMMGANFAVVVVSPS